MAEITTILINGGQPGITGSQIFTGSGAPAPTLGANSDIYVNDDNGDFYKKAAGVWVLQGNFTGPQGIQGIQGIQGPQGDPGVVGSQIFTDSGAPLNGNGANGDFYLNTVNSDYYKKITGAWVLQGNLQGVQGLPGSQLHTGNGAPGGGLGNNTDFYIDNNTGNYYTKSGGVWSLQGQLAGGALRFINTWNATANSPALADGVGTEGSVYIVATAGTTSLDGISTWEVGDWAVFDGTVWRKVENNTVDDSISNGVVSRAPSQNAVFDALALKRDTATLLLNADIDPAAAIDRLKIALGNMYRVLINNGAGEFTEAAAITASRALASDANGIPVHSATTATELGYVNGVTSAIQTQLNGKEPTITVLPETKGGTNQSTYATGDTLYASASNTLSKRTIGSTGQVSKVVGGIPIWEDSISPTAEIRLYDDFMNSPAGAYAWNTLASGAGAAETSVLTNLDANHPGILQLSTGTATNGRTGRTLGGANAAFVSGFVLGGGPITHEWLVRLEDLSTAGEEFNFFAGMQETIAAITAGVYFAYQRSTLGVNWFAVTRSASVSEETDTGVAVAADTWIKLRIEINAAANSIQFYIDGVLVATNTLNIPTIAIAPMIRATKSAGTTARLFYADYFRHYQRFTTPR